MLARFRAYVGWWWTQLLVAPLLNGEQPALKGILHPARWGTRCHVPCATHPVRGPGPGSRPGAFGSRVGCRAWLRESLRISVWGSRGRPSARGVVSAVLGPLGLQGVGEESPARTAGVGRLGLRWTSPGLDRVCLARRAARLCREGRWT